MSLELLDLVACRGRLLHDDDGALALEQFLLVE